MFYFNPEVLKTLQEALVLDEVEGQFDPRLLEQDAQRRVAVERKRAETPLHQPPQPKIHLPQHRGDGR
ncbi:hypothetical protein A3A66_02805 [Microgenomates group bacterium RIFCSPLOWO2_01_FULL_46_13]|nr:MAG: hypothetical protein A2783_00100 [Microgenomates group bacterium RIFCSPHIGHO2_01_FULL_45_11]OGV94897.1 MAG: hypothetical protein A3A66_02805 [Microgenomates group bacterium RIFCSPLOWO2_01_FULL_46_13]